MIIKNVVDGYNVLHQSPTLQTGSGPVWLQQQRNKLIDYIASRLPRETQNQTLVVFDAHTSPSQHTTDFTRGGVKVEFAHAYPEADDRIEELIESHSNPNMLTVVSSDRRLQAAARRRRAEAIGGREWLDMLDQQHDGSSEEHADQPKKLKVRGQNPFMSGEHAAEHKENQVLADEKIKEQLLDADEVAIWMKAILSSPEPMVPKRPLPKVPPKNQRRRKGK